MTRQFSALPVATQMPSNLIGFITGQNQQIPLEVVTAWVTNLFNSLGMQEPSLISFQGEWINGTTYYPANIVTYGGKVYFMLGNGPYVANTRPDLDPTYWLCMFGQTITATDMNLINTNMEFFICNGGANAPSSAPFGYGFTFFNGTSIGIQIYFSSDSTQIWTRQLSGTTWSNWNLIATTYPAVQNVGISGGNAWLSVATGSEFSITVTAACNVGLGGWPTVNNKVCRIRLELINGGAFPVTWTNTITNWVLPNGTISTSFAALGLTLNTSGPNFFEFWSKDGGNTIYGRPLLG